MQTNSQGGFTGGFRAINLNNSALGHTADAESGIQRQRAGGNGLHIHIGAIAQAHNGALKRGRSGCDGYGRVLFVGRKRAEKR